MYFNQYGFGRRLKECRELIDMTQEELAQMVGVELTGESVDKEVIRKQMAEIAYMLSMMSHCM